VQIPEKGRNRNDVLKALERFREDDIDGSRGNHSAETTDRILTLYFNMLFRYKDG